jgi:hypothetical protein
MQIYTNNEDWPNNNMEIWRYFPEDEEREDESLHPFLRDGKWRFIAQDLEYAWNHHGSSTNRARDRTVRNTINGVLTGQGHMQGRSQLFRAVMERDDMRVKFANTLLDLTEGVFSPENVCATLTELVERGSHELTTAYLSDIINPGTRWPTREYMYSQHDLIRNFAQRRPEYIRGHIETTLIRGRRAIAFDESTGRYVLEESVN